MRRTDEALAREVMTASGSLNGEHHRRVSKPGWVASGSPGLLVRLHAGSANFSHCQ